MERPHVDHWLDIDLLIPYLERVQSRGGLDLEATLGRIKEGSMQAFTVGEASAIVSAMDYKGTVYIYAAAGIMDDLLRGLDYLEFWYYYRGGERVEVIGRVGWRRVLGPRGYVLKDGRLQKDLVEWARAAAMHLRTAN